MLEFCTFVNPAVCSSTIVLPQISVGAIPKLYATNCVPFKSFKSGSCSNCLQRLVPRTPTPTTAHVDDVEADATLIAEEKMDRLSYPITRMSCSNDDRAKSSLKLLPTMLMISCRVSTATLVYCNDPECFGFCKIMVFCADHFAERKNICHR